MGKPPKAPTKRRRRRRKRSKSPPLVTSRESVSLSFSASAKTFSDTPSLAGSHLETPILSDGPSTASNGTNITKSSRRSKRTSEKESKKVDRRKNGVRARSDRKTRR